MSIFFIKFILNFVNFISSNILQQTIFVKQYLKNTCIRITFYAILIEVTKKGDTYEEIF